ncbi:MarR family transcriptional regulator [Romboutsia sp.]|uniref:MarR family winged helix-turn-helix transcriptional regulator n=1 Tax=Romboutsia sp. TaxID=1965302 RepID=UPI002C6C7A21|nr:MarR family transcriptional regulator [Romboutsia sp.]HSQ87928.1 MarR family transcriptional regulator [Romboutsia sp.]
MKCIVSDTIGFLSKTFPKIYSSLYLEYLKQYSAIYDVNKTQLRALIFIKNYGDISMTDLCAFLNIEKGSLTSMVDDLTEKGYVIRTKDLSDKRKYIISITEKGTILASDFMDKLSNKLEEKFLKLDEEDQNRYIEAINTLQYILNKEEFN